MQSVEHIQMHRMAGVVQRGYGVAFGHCGELIQGRIQSNSSVHMGLVTLPCNAFFTEAWFCLDSQSGVLAAPVGCTIAKHAVRLALQWAGMPESGCLTLRKNAPVGGGVGSSTLDALASIRAVFNLSQRFVSQTDLLKLCLQAEFASDPIMFAEPERILFDSRAGICLNILDTPPPLWVVFGFDGMAKDTPRNAAWPDISDLIIPLAQAFSSKSVIDIAKISNESACRSAVLTAKPHWQDILFAAKGQAFAAHTGSLVGMICENADIAQKMSTIFAEIGVYDLRWGCLYRGKFFNKTETKT